jgi:phosphoadenosine phosphosulfate reductase
MARLTQGDLSELNKTFEERTPQELIQWGREIFGDRLAALSSMQRAGNVVCHMLHTLKLPVPVLFVDTGVLFQETLDTRDRLIQEYGLEIITLKPEKTMEEQTAELGVLLSLARRPEAVLPSAEDRADAEGQRAGSMQLIGSLRRADGGRRETCPILAIDPEMNTLRINPLVNFSNDEMEQYIAQNHVLINPLHSQGYSTIGCNRCTTPILPNEPHRAGRWRHLGPWSVYCGINPTDIDGDGAPAVEFDQDLVDRILGRETDFMI